MCDIAWTPHPGGEETSVPALGWASAMEMVVRNVVWTPPLAAATGGHGRLRSLGHLGGYVLKRGSQCSLSLSFSNCEVRIAQLILPPPNKAGALIRLILQIGKLRARKVSP